MSGVITQVTSMLPSFGRSQPPMDLIEKITGAFGMYQFYLCCLMFLSKFFVIWHQMAILFLAPKIKFTCDGVENACPCSNPVYDVTIFETTIISEWNLICERTTLTTVAQSIFQAGVLTGSVLFGMAGDRFGRKNPLLFSVVLETIAGVLTGVVKSYWLFATMRFLTGFATGGNMVITFVLLLEYIGKKYRSLISALYHVPFNVGHVMLPLFGYYIRNYRHFQIAISAPAALMFCYFCFVPDSARWLISVKQPEAAIKILNKAAKINKRPTDSIRADVDKFERELIAMSKAKKGNIIDLFRTPNIRKNIIAMSLNWFTCGYCFYGTSQYVGQLGGNLFINIACGAGLTVCGTLLSIPLLTVIGRKTILIVCNGICAVSLLCLAIDAEGKGNVICAAIVQVSSFVMFVVVYLYCTELFPTVVRNAAMGICSMLARVGSIIAPFIVHLNSFHYWLPGLVLAIAPCITIFVTFLLPETKGCELMNTIEEGEAFGKKAPRK